MLGADRSGTAAARSVRPARAPGRGRRAADPRRAGPAAPRPRPRRGPRRDVPLLDEAAELLGEDDSTVQAAQAQAAAERQAEVDYAEQVQDTFGGADFQSAEDLAGRYVGSRSLGSVAERAEADRSWAFGHVVIDEAQELSPMAWRLLMRRCPSRSFTVVGDVAQTGSPAGAQRLGRRAGPARRRPVDAGRADRELPHARAGDGPGRRACSRPAARRCGRRRRPGSAGTRPSSPRVDGGRRRRPPWVTSSSSEWRQAADGTVVVITPGRAARPGRRRPFAPPCRDGIVSADSDTLGAPVSVLTVAGAKGLEFDTVVLRRAGRDRGRVPARAQRPLRRADPGHPAAAHRPPGRPAAGDVKRWPSTASPHR